MESPIDLNEEMPTAATTTSTTINAFPEEEVPFIEPASPIEGIDLPMKIRKFVNIKSKTGREFIAEIFGTCVLVLFACGAGFELKFMKLNSPGDNNVVSANLAGGLSLTLVIVFIGKISGAHVNPAVSFAMYLTGRMSLFRFFIYMLAQFIGAFVASCILYVAYYDAINNYPHDKFNELVGLFGTFPHDKLGTFGGLFDLIIGPMLLVMTVLALTDKNNSGLSAGSTAILAGLCIFAIESSFGYNTGNALNPARDFSPRLFSSIIWGSKAFSGGNYFFWIPLIGPMLGSFLAVIIYTLMVGNNLY